MKLRALASARTPSRPVTLKPRRKAIELFAEHGNVSLVLSCDHAYPRSVSLDCVLKELASHGWGKHNLPIKIMKEVELAHSGQVEYWGSVGNDDQAPGSLFTRSKSCSIASIP
jgi:hypothetical protein